jgi:uncharacterized membrane-anchored protein
LQVHDRTVLLAATGFQLVVLVSMIAASMMPILTGDTVLLRVRPVDPRDLFRGDYVILSYELSSAPWDLRASPGQTVYVSLEPEGDGRHWQARRFSLEQPATDVFLRGTVARGNRVEYGIESHFVQEGEGLKYERAVGTRKLSARVAVAPNGKAVLQGLVIE